MSKADARRAIIDELATRWDGHSDLTIDPDGLAPDRDESTWRDVMLAADLGGWFAAPEVDA